MDAHDWQAVWTDFLAAEHTWGPTAGAAAAWHQGREAWAVWVLRVRPPALLHAVQRALGPLIEPVAPERAHVTFWVAGFVAEQPAADDEVSPLALEASAARLAQAHLPRLVLGGASSFTSAPILEVWDPQHELAALRDSCRPLPEQRRLPFRPHLTVGTWRDRLPTAEAAARLTPWRSPVGLPLEIEAIELWEVDARSVGTHRVRRVAQRTSTS